jgi:hypothetical protein
MNVRSCKNSQVTSEKNIARDLSYQIPNRHIWKFDQIKDKLFSKSSQDK